MEIILLEPIHNLGGIGSRTHVRSGYARNFLFPRGKALPVNEENLRAVEAQREELETRQAELRTREEQLAQQVNETTLDIEASCGPEGQLHGSIRAAEIVAAAKENGLPALTRQMLHLPAGRLSAVGEYEISVHPGPGVDATLRLRIISSTQA